MLTSYCQKLKLFGVFTIGLFDIDEWLNSIKYLHLSNDKIFQIRKGSNKIAVRQLQNERFKTD